MNFKYHLMLAGVLALLPGLMHQSRADEIADKGREIFKKHQHAVLTVQVVVKMKFSVPGLGGQDNESKQDVTATVVDPSGLAVLSLSSIEPGNMLENLMAGMADEDAKFKMETELTDVKMLLDDGSELPAEVVLRDKDLDLAFVRPKTKPASPMAALDLTKSSTAQVLDQVITLNRLGKAAGRAYAVSVERITAVVQKPRLFYIPDSTMTSTSQGSPGFTTDGNLLGIFVIRSVSSKGSGMSMFSMQPEGLTGIILPAADVLKAAKQAPAKAEDTKSDAKEKKE
jgi:hypothetical protein